MEYDQINIDCKKRKLVQEIEINYNKRKNECREREVCL